MANIIVGGFTPQNYDSERDPRGDIGHSLAEALYQRHGSKVFTKSADRNYLENLASIALARFPELAPGETIHEKEISKRLSQIRAAGYEVKPYSGKSKEEKWAQLTEIRRDIRRSCELYPDILEAIDQANSERKSDAELLR